MVVGVLDCFRSPISQQSKERLKSERTILCGSIRTDSQTDIKLYGRTDSWTNVQMLTNGRQAVWADRQLDERSDGQTGRFEQIRYPRIPLLSSSQNGKAK